MRRKMTRIRSSSDRRVWHHCRAEPATDAVRSAPSLRACIARCRCASASNGPPTFWPVVRRDVMPGDAAGLADRRMPCDRGGDGLGVRAAAGLRQPRSMPRGRKMCSSAAVGRRPDRTAAGPAAGGCHRVTDRAVSAAASPRGTAVAAPPTFRVVRHPHSLPVWVRARRRASAELPIYRFQSIDCRTVPS